MNNHMVKNIGILVVGVILIILGSYWGANKGVEDAVEPQPSLGGGGGNYAYNSTTTDATWSSRDGQKIIKTGPGVLRTVNFPVVTTGTLELYDATTTISHANHATTTLHVFPISTVGGSYDINVAFTRGLLAVWSATAGGIATSTIISE